MPDSKSTIQTSLRAGTGFLLVQQGKRFGRNRRQLIIRERAVILWRHGARNHLINGQLIIVRQTCEFFQHHLGFRTHARNHYWLRIRTASAHCRNGCTQNPRPCMQERGVNEMISYLRRRKSNKDAIPSPARTNVLGSGITGFREKPSNPTNAAGVPGGDAFGFPVGTENTVEIPYAFSMPPAAAANAAA